MSVILRNDNGAIAVNKGVIERMIIEDLLDLGEDIILCSKKGKPIGEKPSRFMDPDYLDAIELSEKKRVVRIRIFLITRIGNSISDLAEQIFDIVTFEGKDCPFSMLHKALVDILLNSASCFCVIFFCFRRVFIAFPKSILFFFTEGLVPKDATNTDNL